MDCIRTGDFHALQSQLQQDWRAYYWAALPDAGMYPVILPYLCGCCLTLAMDGGPPLPRGVALSALYLTKSRTVTTLDDFVDTLLQMQMAFTEEVHHYKRCHSGNRAVDQCLMYLYDHINERISVAFRINAPPAHFLYLTQM